MRFLLLLLLSLSRVFSGDNALSQWKFLTDSIKQRVVLFEYEYGFEYLEKEYIYKGVKGSIYDWELSAETYMKSKDINAFLKVVKEAKDLIDFAKRKTSEENLKI